MRSFITLEGTGVVVTVNNTGVIRLEINCFNKCLIFLKVKLFAFELIVIFFLFSEA